MPQRATMVRILSILGMFLAVVGSAYGNDELAFIAPLSGEQEIIGAAPFVAPQLGVATDTAGRLRLTFDPTLTRGTFRLRVTQGTGITQAHLHCAPAGVNGPIVVFLFGRVDPGVPVDGLLSEGELTNASFVPGVDCIATCGKSVNNIASLRAAILDGCIYANVHSELNRGGEVRGQVRPLEDAP